MKILRWQQRLMFTLTRCFQSTELVVEFTPTTGRYSQILSNNTSLSCWGEWPPPASCGCMLWTCWWTSWGWRGSSSATLWRCLVLVNRYQSLFSLQLDDNNLICISMVVSTGGKEQELFSLHVNQTSFSTLSSAQLSQSRYLAECSHMFHHRFVSWSGQSSMDGQLHHWTVSSTGDCSWRSWQACRNHRLLWIYIWICIRSETCILLFSI